MSSNLSPRRAGLKACTTPAYLPTYLTYPTPATHLTYPTHVTHATHLTHPT